ncbi:hypothetical protein EBB07_34435 [Paenibacillaceae bacterium]|nr:hypothetical protein EBB07_34435 [Paenibacillaceae bacterium]
MSLLFPIITVSLIAIGAFCLFIALDNQRKMAQQFASRRRNTFGQPLAGSAGEAVFPLAGTASPRMDPASTALRHDSDGR